MSTFANPAELRRRGLEILVRQLGYADAMRFLLQYETGRGDYTREREQFLPPWSPEELLDRGDALATRKPPAGA